MSPLSMDTEELLKASIEENGKPEVIRIDIGTRIHIQGSSEVSLQGEDKA